MKHTLQRCVNIADLRTKARRRLPRALFDYIDGMAEDGITGAANRRAFDNYRILPNTLVDVENIDTSVTVLGEKLAYPIILGPTAFTRAFHHKGETAVANAAKKAGLLYALSTVANTSIEDIAATGCPRWFQIYVYKDREILRDFLTRCHASGYGALCLTVDASVPGNREHDQRNGLSIPPRPSAATIFEAIRHPAWCWHLLTSAPIITANVSGKSGLDGSDAQALLQYMHEQLAINVSWDDVAWMMEEWQGPFIIKGILHVEDAIRAADLGVHGIVVSNHGGRQLDCVPAALDVLPDIVEAVGDRCEVFIDSGFRRGTDIIKALALGARACLVGRSYLYGLAAGGEAGVERALDILTSEFKRNLALMGRTSVSQLDGDCLVSKKAKH